MKNGGKNKCCVNFVQCIYCYTKQHIDYSKIYPSFISIVLSLEKMVH